MSGQRLAKLNAKGQNSPELRNLRCEKVGCGNRKTRGFPSEEAASQVHHMAFKDLRIFAIPFHFNNLEKV